MAIVWSLYLSFSVILILASDVFATLHVLANSSLADVNRNVTNSFTIPSTVSASPTHSANTYSTSLTNYASGITTIQFRPSNVSRLLATTGTMTSAKDGHNASAPMRSTTPAHSMNPLYSSTFTSENLDEVHNHIKTKMKSSTRISPAGTEVTTSLAQFPATLPATENSVAVTQPFSNLTTSATESVSKSRSKETKGEMTARTIIATDSVTKNKEIVSAGSTSILIKSLVTTASSVDRQNSNSIKVTNDKRTLNKEHLQFPGITLKVSHVLIPKQKRSRYNIQNMRIELPKTEILRKSPASVARTSKNSNCTRFPVQVVTAADSESNEKVNLTEEHYDCEFSSQIQNIQKKEPVDSIHTYYGGYVFRYTIPKMSTNRTSMENQTSTEATKPIQSTTVDENDDYDSSYVEYPEPSNPNNSAAIDDAVFPDPVIRSEKKLIHVKPEKFSVPVSDSSSLLDGDLHDHDLIDSAMYIYFGGASHGQRGAGRQIIIVGAVIALVAQFLTLASSVRRIKTHKGEEPTVILLNVETALTLTNLIFILGVQSTGDHTLCKITAVSLYYLHLTALIWFLLSSLYSVQIVCQIKPPYTFFTYCVGGWLAPFIFTLLSYSLNKRSFETSLYCWVSPLKGILFSFILPVILLCIICTVSTIYGLKHSSEPVEEADDTYSHRKLLRISAISLPLFAVIWFTGMVALENSTSLLFSLIFLISDTILNWLLFAFWLPSEASQWKDMDEDYYDDEEDYDDEPVLVKRRFDDQPLLSELYEYGARGQLYNLKVEPISIISTH